MNARAGSITFPLRCDAVIGGGGNGFYGEKLLVTVFGFLAPGNGIAVFI